MPDLLATNRKSTVRLTLDLHQGEDGILCQFGVASPGWGILNNWFNQGCRRVVISNEADPSQPSYHLTRAGASDCIFLTDRGIHQVLLPIDGHSAINGFKELWIWP